MPKVKPDAADEASMDDEHLPGKNRNSFLVFQSEYRAKLKKDHPEMSHADMQAKISAKWKELDEEKKQKYEVAAAKEFVQYVRKMAEQKDNHPELFDRSLTKPGKASGKRRGPGMTGYLLYVKERMAPAKEENPESKQTELTKIIAAEWKALDQARKDKYNEKAKKMKAEAEAEGEHDADGDGEAETETKDKKRKSPDDNADAASSKAKKAKTEEKPPAVVAKKDKAETRQPEKPSQRP
eukprot:TRINITY_DN4021_c0_g1_i2.p1 TRINITY_DN4021_c0_g1~~TRINITY_DN4021_c0_g1_i2.p1  ORF type:complete len:239 (-),score=97.09 TRINITY_DN4021_c0_g1_i2:285-1001(-)